MKITRKQLKQLIKNYTLLNEGAQPSYGLSEERYAILTDYNTNIFPKPQANTRYYPYNWILFDAQKVIDELLIKRDINKEKNKVGDIIISNTKAVLSAWDPSIDNPNLKSNGAFVVSRSAADDNFGPTLYDLVMSALPNGLTPDWNSLSKEARKVWQYYANKRPDVTKHFLDDYNNPQTQNNNDDAYLNPDIAKRINNIPFTPTTSFDRDIPEDEYVHMSYTIDKNEEYDLLVYNFENFLNIINKIPADTNFAIQKWHEFKDSDDPSPGITGISFSAPCYVAGSFFIQRYKGQ